MFKVRFFKGNPNLGVLGALKTIFRVISERRVKHGHDLGQGVNYLFFNLHIIHVLGQFFKANPNMSILETLKAILGDQGEMT